MVLTIFCAYSQRDTLMVKDFLRYLTSLQRKGLIKIIESTEVRMENDWEYEIDGQLARADIVLTFLSPDFLNSNYIYSIEMKQALKRSEKGETRVIPIILRPVYWEATPLAKLQALPKNGKAIATWSNWDEAFTEIAKEITKIVTDALKPIGYLGYLARYGRYLGRIAKSSSFHSVLIAIISASAGGILYGIIGNRADSLFVTLISFIQANPWLWSIATFVGIFSIITFLTLRHIKRLNRALTSITFSQESDFSLLRLLANWTPPLPDNRDIQMQRILKEVLTDATVAFGGNSIRAAILLPDSTGDYLECWASYQMPQESIHNMRFYIGNDPRERLHSAGIGGAVYRNQEIIVAHITQKNSHWECDYKDYIKFPGTRPSPPYRSFINIPIMSISHDKYQHPACLGVLCFDSLDKHIFDSKESKDIIRSIARRVTCAILICNQLQTKN